jgi:uncharacterized membrane protein
MAESREGFGVKVQAGRRFWDVDVVRGVAIVMVAFYHLIPNPVEECLDVMPTGATSGSW